MCILRFKAHDFSKAPNHPIGRISFYRELEDKSTVQIFICEFTVAMDKSNDVNLGADDKTS